MNPSRLIIRPRGLIAQFLLWVIVPLLIIIIAVTYGGVSLYEHEMRDLIGDRDSRATHATAQALSDRFSQRQLMREVLVNRLANGVSLAHVLASEASLKLVFDGGLIAVDSLWHIVDT